MKSWKRMYGIFVIIFSILLLIIVFIEGEKKQRDERRLGGSFVEYLQEQVQHTVLHVFAPYLLYRKDNRKGISQEEAVTSCGKSSGAVTSITYLSIEDIERKETKEKNRTQEIRKDTDQEAEVINTQNSKGQQNGNNPNTVNVISDNTGCMDNAGKNRQKQLEIRAEDYSSYEALVNNFYTIDAGASAGPDLLEINSLMSREMQIEKSQNGPQILIYHTHSQEGFADSVPGEDDTTIMAVGEKLANILEEEYGYCVYHYYGKYDLETRNDAYSRALEDLEKVLELYPSIQVILDIHRDDMREENHLVTQIDGKPTAKFMFFNGVSRSAKNGDIGYLYNPNLKDNLAFSFQAKVLAEEYYPGLTRRNYIQAYRYNLHLLPRSMLIEIGAQNNTLEEELNACEPLAHILDMVLQGEK